MDSAKKSGAEALIHSLHLEGVELMFGYPGGAALHIYDAIFNQNYVFLEQDIQAENNL